MVFKCQVIVLIGYPFQFQAARGGLAGRGRNIRDQQSIRQQPPRLDCQRQCMLGRQRRAVEPTERVGCWLLPLITRTRNNKENVGEGMQRLRGQGKPNILTVFVFPSQV